MRVCALLARILSGARHGVNGSVEFFKKRIYNYKDLVSCSSYLKRDKNFKESKCQCKSCLENEMLIDEEEEWKCSKENLTTRKD